jgi:hypothetical protein
LFTVKDEVISRFTDQLNSLKYERALSKWLDGYGSILALAEIRKATEKQPALPYVKPGVNDRILAEADERRRRVQEMEALQARAARRAGGEEFGDVFPHSPALTAGQVRDADGSVRGDKTYGVGGDVEPIYSDFLTEQ